MLSQEVRTARQVVEDYKRLNQNTVKVVSRIDPKMKCIYYETIKVDENAGQFAQLYKEKKKIKKQEKHLGKQLMNAPKIAKPTKVIAPKVNKERVYVPRDIPEERLQLMAQAYDMRYMKGMKMHKIAEELKINRRTVGVYIKAHMDSHKLPLIPHESLQVLDLIKKNMTIPHVAKELGLKPATVHYHVKKLKEHFPDLVINTERSGRKLSPRTFAIQRLLKENKSPADIAFDLNVSEKSVNDNIYRYEKRHGTYERKEILTETFWEVKKLHETGMATADIARKLSIRWETAKKNIDKIERLK